MQLVLKYAHYECLGLNVVQISNLINQDPGIYICKACGPQLSKKDLSGLKKQYPKSAVFQFNEASYQAVIGPSPSAAELEKKVDERLSSFEARVLTNIVDISTSVQTRMASFSDVVKSNLAQPRAAQPPSRAPLAQPYKADPR
jgi:hypothetical protein